MMSFEIEWLFSLRSDLEIDSVDVLGNFVLAFLPVFLFLTAIYELMIIDSFDKTPTVTEPGASRSSFRHYFGRYFNLEKKREKK
jgi:hypothetical protein